LDEVAHSSPQLFAPALRIIVRSLGQHLRELQPEDRALRPLEVLSDGGAEQGLPGASRPVHPRVLLPVAQRVAEALDDICARVIEVETSR